jgi:transcriptional regulator GlxA family with amidase domain
MQIAILLYDRFTALDVVGPYDVLSRLPGADVVLTGIRRGPVSNEVGSLPLTTVAALGDVPHPDVVVVPGGPGWAEAAADAGVLRWLADVDRHTTWTTSVCTGSLLLASAGLLDGRPATTHWLARDLLTELGAHTVEERVVRDGKYLTAAGVSAGIDMALTLAGLAAGDAVARTIQLALEYDPRPPYDAGSPRTAPARVTENLRARRRTILF